MIQEHERVVLKTPVAAEGLEAGDVGTVVHVYRDGLAYEVEFVALQDCGFLEANMKVTYGPEVDVLRKRQGGRTNMAEVNMTITRQTVAEKLAAYLHHQTPLAQLVDWAENAVMAGEFTPTDAPMLTQIVARLGLADVRAFGLTWEDCEQTLRTLGYTVRVELVPA